ncbi:MAG TPA: sigma-70 family RNA polymerase sigma factor [Terriglobales bacterium]|nr:sigma-70 family RNA polymerase sigma factor [Terriglobales bacterium]
MTTTAAFQPPLEPGVCFTTEEHSDSLSAFLMARPRIFGIAYRMLGNATQAEDIVQDVWLRWQCRKRGTVENPPAFLAVTTTRLCITLTQSARSRHETHIGEWFQYPVDSHGDPGLFAEREQALQHAVHLLLERLSPAERAAYILREAFEYSYRKIADVLHIEEPNARQLVFRARRHLVDGRCVAVDPEEQRRLLTAFISAEETGQMSALESLFAEDISSSSARSEFKNALAPAPRCTSPGPDIATTVSPLWNRGPFDICDGSDRVWTA